MANNRDSGPMCPINEQEAMENFVFPNEIKTKLMKMNKLINIFYAKEPNILRERA